MRKLSAPFMQALKSGILADITDQVVHDFDLDLHIRDNYLNLYYKGNSLLKLTETRPGRYQVDIHEKFKQGLDIPEELSDEAAARHFMRLIPHIKQNIIIQGKGSLEIEYEQMIIRANNFEPRNNSEYFIVDRQYPVDTGRFDLTGIYWNRNRRRQGQEVPMCLMEVKFAINQDIGQIHDQLERYYKAIKVRAASIAEEGESIFRQKLELGLYKGSREQLEALQTLTFARDIERFQFILILVDYNPNSKMLKLRNLENLPFSKQIKVFRGGFAMWQLNVLDV